MERYQIVLKSYRRLPAKVVKLLSENVHSISLPANSSINPIEENIDSIYFVEKGLLQLYSMNGRKKITARFKKEDEFIICLKALPVSREYCIEALEDCLLWNISGDLIEKVFKLYPPFNHHHSIILCKDLVASGAARDCSLSENDPNNYYQLCAQFPELLHRVPIPILANFTWLSEPMFRHLHSKSSLKRLKA